MGTMRKKPAGETMKQQNVGPLDRATRIILGALLILIRYVLKIPGVIGDLVVIWGAVWIWEGLLGYCLLYGILNWSTKRKDGRKVGAGRRR